MTLPNRVGRSQRSSSEKLDTNSSDAAIRSRSATASKRAEAWLGRKLNRGRWLNDPLQPQVDDFPAPLGPRQPEASPGCSQTFRNRGA